MKTVTDDQTYLPANADSLARIHTAEAMGTIVDIMRGDAEGTHQRLALQLKAAETILDRGHGRAVQAVISVPARQAVAAKLAAMSDDALLLIAQRGRQKAEGVGGVGPETGDPMPGANGSVPSSQLPTAFKNDHVTDAEFDEDPCA